MRFTQFPLLSINLDNTRSKKPQGADDGPPAIFLNCSTWVIYFLYLVSWLEATFWGRYERIPRSLVSTDGREGRKLDFPYSDPDGWHQKCGLPNFRSSLLTETTQKEAKSHTCVVREWSHVVRVHLKNNLFKVSTSPYRQYAAQITRLAAISWRWPPINIFELFDMSYIFFLPCKLTRSYVMRGFHGV